MASTHLRLPYGRTLLRLDPPPLGRRIVLEPEGLPLPEDPAKILRRALDQPVASPPLRELARGRRTAAILIPGKTRVAATQHYVPALLDELAAAGLEDDAITIHLATGTHEHHLEDDLAHLLGSEVTLRVRCRAHACTDPTTLTSLGQTRAGTPVSIATAVLEADLKILTGRIVPHYFAGFSGGRKALVPGVAGFDTIRANHRLTLAAKRGLREGVAPASLADNPIHLDMEEAAALARPDFCLNTVLDANGRLVSAFAGDWREAFAIGCREVEKNSHFRVATPVDALVTSAGGLPHDIDFMQALKAVLNLQSIVRPGGSILWLAECSRGIQPGFLDWADIVDDDELERTVRSNYALTGHNAIMLRHLIRKASVHLYSSLPEADVRRMGFVPVASPEEGMERILRGQPEDVRCAVAPCANIVCASLEPDLAA